MDFKNVIKNIRANESLGYLYTEKEVLTSHNLTVEQLTEGAVSSFCFNSTSGYEVKCLTFDFANKDIVIIHIILDYINKFIVGNIGKSVLESELTKYNIKLEKLIQVCSNYHIVEIFNNRVMILFYKELGILSIILGC